MASILIDDDGYLDTNTVEFNYNSNSIPIIIQTNSFKFEILFYYNSN